MTVRNLKDIAAEERFWAKVVVDCACDCWVWVASRTPDGYGQFAWKNQRPVLAHRAAYETWREPIASGLELDHLCRNRACVNPWHLEQVTRLVNVMRGEHPLVKIARSGKCRRGHAMSGSNVGGGTKERRCLACKRIGKANRTKGKQ